MTEESKGQPGSIFSADLTVHHAKGVRDFYKEEIGWQHSDFQMGEYADYMMNTPDGKPVAGICHQVGVNAGLPQLWIVYFAVADLKQSLEMCRNHGGIVHRQPEGAITSGSYAIIEYPAGAFCGISQI
ncbi:glyoxalase [Planococcus antarcticus DSM 14505]|uniref:Glyoxalase n=1 Tax=Planococcus antarcticus DSM 14505 TaxID=1185653 RepID=A0ABM6D3W0_9BACL|nr:glyoxalase [Planococcus antarcticus]ANU10160.1 glyoxalase [Planococcus antarcticus DSM 14505]